MSCSGSIDFYSRLVVVMVCGGVTLPALVTVSAGVGTITTGGEENRFKRETQSPLHNAYIPGRHQRFPVVPIPSQHEGRLLTETNGHEANDQPHPDSIIVRPSRLIGHRKLNPHKAAQHDLRVPRGGNGGSRGSKARYLQPRIFRGDGGPGVGTGKSASSSNLGRLNPKEPTIEQRHARANRPPFTFPGPSSYRSIEPTGFRNIQTYQMSSDETGSVHKLGIFGGSFGDILSNDGKATLRTDGPADAGRFSPRVVPPSTGSPTKVLLDPVDEAGVHQSDATLAHTQSRTGHGSQRLSPQAPPRVVHPLSAKRGAFWKSQSVEPSTQSSTRSVISRKSRLFISHKKALSDGLISLGNRGSTVNTPKVDNRAPGKVSEPAPREPNEGKPVVRKAGKSYLFNSYQTSGKHEAANNVSGDRQHTGKSISPSTWRQNTSPFLKMASQLSSPYSQVQLSQQETPSSDVRISFNKAMLPGTQNGSSMAHFQAPPTPFGGPSWLKFQQSVVKDYKKPPASPYGGLSKKTSLQRYSLDKNTHQQTENARNFNARKYEFSRGAGVIFTTTMAPLEAETERGPQKYHIQMGSNSIIAPKAVFRSNSKMPNKSMLWANDVPSRQGKSKALQDSNVPLKPILSESEYKPAFRGVQPLNLNMASKLYLQEYMSNNEKYRVGVFTGLPFRTYISGQLEGANALAAHTIGNDLILEPPRNGLISLNATMKKAPSLSQGSLQGGSAVYRIGTSHAKEIATASLIQSTPDDEERSLKSIPITDGNFSNRMLTTSNAFLGPRSPIRQGGGMVLHDWTPSAYKTGKHLPSHRLSFPEPFEGQVRDDVGETVLSSETRQSEKHPGLNGPKDTELPSGNAEFTQKHLKSTPVNATSTESRNDLKKPNFSLSDTVHAGKGPTPLSPDPRWAIETPLTPVVYPAPWPRTLPDTPAVPMNGNRLYNPRPSRTMVRGRRVKGKRVKVKTPGALSNGSSTHGPTVQPSRLKNIIYADILGSASFSSVTSKSQNGDKMAGRYSGTRTKPKVNSFSAARLSPWDGNASSYGLDSRQAPKQIGVKGSGEQAGRGGERVEFSSVRVALGDQWSGDSTHLDKRPTQSTGGGRKVLAKGQSGNFLDISSHASENLAAADEEELLELNYLKTSVGNTSFKSAKAPHSDEATQT